MEFTYFRNLNKNELYAATKRQLKLFFSDIEELSVLYGLNRKFLFDPRCSNRPKLSGIVVASISYHRDRSINFYLYPLSLKNYPENALADFNHTVLSDIKHWLQILMSNSDTSLLGIYTLVIEWDGDKHIFHRLKLSI